MSMCSPIVHWNDIFLVSQFIALSCSFNFVLCNVPEVSMGSLEIFLMVWLVLQEDRQEGGSGAQSRRRFSLVMDWVDIWRLEVTTLS